jgi:hypothetical protein
VGTTWGGSKLGGLKIIATRPRRRGARTSQRLYTQHAASAHVSKWHTPSLLTSRLRPASRNLLKYEHSFVAVKVCCQTN